MGQENRNWYRGKHPPSCTCVECTTVRHPNSDPPMIKCVFCPKCGQRSFWYNERYRQHECLNYDCRYIRPDVHAQPIISEKPTNPLPQHPPPVNKPPPKRNRVNSSFPNELKALLLIVIASAIGMFLSTYTYNLIALWILFGFSIVFSIEKWAGYFTRKHRNIGKLYRLGLILSFWSLLGITIWSGVMLFTQQLQLGSLISSLLFMGECVFFIWLWRVVAKNSWRWPSMKLTTFALIAAFLVFAYSGVQPMARYKDTSVSNLSSFFNDFWAQTTQYRETTQTYEPIQATSESPITTATHSTTTNSTVPSTTYSGINSKTGVYGNYFLGLIKESSGTEVNSYGDFIVLINNKNAKNPTYAQLLDFLMQDKTDQYPYKYVMPLLTPYYGTAESHVDLGNIKAIIDGTIQPNPPRICADFAQRLHNDAELAGIRCGYVTMTVTGYSDPAGLGISSNSGHAIDVFETTDRGTIYIDDTGNADSYGPPNNDAIVAVVQVGTPYNPQYLFPSGGWYITTGQMGTVTSLYITWDGNWNN